MRTEGTTVDPHGATPAVRTVARALELGGIGVLQKLFLLLEELFVCVDDCLGTLLEMHGTRFAAVAMITTTRHGKDALLVLIALCSDWIDAVSLLGPMNLFEALQC